jgi:hypothetical protein
MRNKSKGGLVGSVPDLWVAGYVTVLPQLGVVSSFLLALPLCP